MGNPETVTKTVVLNRRTVTAMLGSAKIARTNDELIFDVCGFLNGIKNSLAPNAPVSVVESIIVNKLKRAMNRFPSDVVDTLIKEQNTPGIETSIEIVVAGFENGAAVIRKIKGKWNDRKIASPQIETVYPVPDSPIGSHVPCFGYCNSFANVTRYPNSPERMAALARYPGVILGLNLFSKKILPDSGQGLSIATGLIRLEAEFNSENVGPPIDVVVLSNTRPPKISSLPK